METVDAQPSPLYAASLPPGRLRLLELHHSSAHVTELMLNEFDLFQSPRYLALSYTWGPPEESSLIEATASACHNLTEQHTVIVNGQAVVLGGNLKDFFVHFASHRQRDSHLALPYIWIDVLCINQDDHVEKAAQVSQMDAIFHGSQRVVVWLGVIDVRSFEVVGSMIGGLAKASEELLVPGAVKGMYLTNLLDPDQMRQIGLASPKAGEWLEFLRFYQRRWFRRVWTLQEVSLASEVDVLCGQFSITWGAITKAVALLGVTPLITALLELGRQTLPLSHVFMLASRHAHIRALALRHLPGDDAKILWRSAALWGEGETPAREGSFLDLLLEFGRGFGAEDLRDKVFSLKGVYSRLLAVPQDKVEYPIDIDYDRPVNQVFIEVATFVIRSTGTLTILSRVGNAMAKSVKGLPSWVPDYSADQPVTLSALNRFQALKHSERTTYNASNGARIGFRIEGLRLHCSVMFLAEVVGVGETLEEIRFKPHYTFERTAKLVLDSLKLRPGSAGERIRELYETMICGITDTSAYGRETPENAFRRGFRDMLLRSCVAGVRSQIEIGIARAAALADRPMQHHLSKVDDSATIPKLGDIADACDNHMFSTNNEHFGRDIGDDFFALTVVKTMQLRRMVLLDSGAFGLACVDVQCADRVCVIADGGRVPFVLRTAGSASPHEWKLICEVFVNGMMYGEAVERTEEEGRKWQSVCLT